MPTADFSFFFAQRLLPRLRQLNLRRRKALWASIALGVALAAAVAVVVFWALQKGGVARPTGLLASLLSCFVASAFALFRLLKKEALRQWGAAPTAAQLLSEPAGQLFRQVWPESRYRARPEPYPLADLQAAAFVQKPLGRATALQSVTAAFQDGHQHSLSELLAERPKPLASERDGRDFLPIFRGLVGQRTFAREQVFHLFIRSTMPYEAGNDPERQQRLARAQKQCGPYAERWLFHWRPERVAGVRGVKRVDFPANRFNQHFEVFSDQPHHARLLLGPNSQALLLAIKCRGTPLHHEVPENIYRQFEPFFVDLAPADRLPFFLLSLRNSRLYWGRHLPGDWLPRRLTASLTTPQTWQCAAQDLEDLLLVDRLAQHWEALREPQGGD